MSNRDDRRPKGNTNDQELSRRSEDRYLVSANHRHSLSRRTRAGRSGPRDRRNDVRLLNSTHRGAGIKERR